jgi:hypothetical protein
MTRTEDHPLSARDATVLGPLAEHRLLTVPQLARLLEVSESTAVRHLRALQREQMLALRPIFHGLPWAASIQVRGLRALGSPLKAPRLNLNQYRHDVGVGWMWLAARAGRLGALTGLRTERSMMAADYAARAGGGPAVWGLGLGLLGSHGQPHRHYPDLMLDTAAGQRVAVELELTAKSSGRMARIMAAYASDARIDQVLYVVADRSIGSRVRESARRSGAGERVHVQLLGRDGIAGAEIGRVGAARNGPAAVAGRGAEQPAREAATR